MKNQLFLFLILLVLVLSTVSYVKADIVDVNGVVLARGPYIQSPTNSTYNYDSLTLAVNFYADWFKAWDYSIKYSLDGKANQTLSLELFKSQSGQSNVSVVSVPFFNLSEGAHHLTVFIQLATANKTYFDSQTVVFAINVPSPSPSVPECPITMLLFAVLFPVSLLLILGKRKLRFN